MNRTTSTLIISPVGDRPVAVLSPILSLLHHNIVVQPTIVRLLTTKHSKPMAERCSDWLRAHVRGTSIEMVEIGSLSAETISTQIDAHNGPVLFNLNPGLGWYLATLCLHLPMETMCFSSDSEFLSVRSLGEDIADAKSWPLVDIGLSAWSNLSRDIMVKYRHGVDNEFLASEVSGELRRHGFHGCFSISPRLNEKEPVSADFNPNALLDPYLAWIREQHGHLHLLFDFTNIEGRKKNWLEQKNDLVKYLLAVYPPMYYRLSVICDDPWMRDRLNYDDIATFDSRDRNWSDQLREWLRGTQSVTPKRIMPPSLSAILLKDAMPEKQPSSVLFTCLGDRVETTLLAINSSTADQVMMFYDCQSPRITALAQRLATSFSRPDRKIHTLPTDHRGYGIHPLIEQIVDAWRESDIQFNITPGTKEMTVQMTVAARKCGLSNKVVSIETKSKRIYQLKPPEALTPLKPVGPSAIIACHPIMVTEDTDNLVRGELWAIIRSDLTKNVIVPAHSLWKLRLRIGGHTKPYCKPVGSERIYLYSRKKEFTLPSAFIDGSISEGTWWEVVVARSFRDALRVDVHLQHALHGTRFDGNQQIDQTICEVDVVTEWENSILVISCKAGRQFAQKNRLSLETLAIKGIAKTRYERFALPCLALPEDTYRQKPIAGRIINGVLIITPSLLKSKEELIPAIQEFKASLKTT